ncbi:hypothetical protein QUC31_019809 [Theobroma cacao]
MGSESQFQIPVIELPIESEDLRRGTDKWQSLCRRGRTLTQSLIMDTMNRVANSFLSMKALDLKMPPTVTLSKASPSLCGLMAMITAGYPTVGLPHTDKFYGALLCEDRISGLEIETKDGQWVKLFPSPGSFVFIVGDLLTTWSNGRMHAAKHRVMMSGDKDRYSLGAFAVPVEDTIIRAPREMVDEEHPQVFKGFDLMDFLNYADSEESMAIDSSKKLFIFAAQPKRVV